MDSISNNSFALAGKTLDALWLRQKVIAGNLANVDTPGYKSRSVTFESLMEGAVSRSHNIKDLEKRVSSLSPSIERNESVSMREDGNSVDVDAENVEMARAQLQYEYMIRVLSSEVSRMKYAINEGR